MRNRLRLPAIFLGLAALALGQTRSNDAQLTLLGGTIHLSPTEEPIVDGVIVIRNGKVTAVGRKGSIEIPESVETLDCSGLTIAAGFWNNHVHFSERKWASAETIPAAELSAQLREMLLSRGFTSVFDTGSTWRNTRRLRDRIENGEVPGPRIRSTGEFLIPKGGAPPDLVADVRGFIRDRFYEIPDEAEASAASKRLLDEGVDGIKLYVRTFAPPIASLPENLIEAAVREARRVGKPVFAHPTNREGLLASLRGGVDVIVHTTPQSDRWDEIVLAAMKEAEIALIPTLKLWKYELRHDRISTQERFVNAGVEQLRDWAAAGGTVLFGTDVGYMSDYDPTEEYILMAEAGLTPRQILASLTTAPAEYFGESGRLGRVAPGLAADLVVLSGDPLKDVRAFAAVRYTIRSGRVIYQASDGCSA